MLLEVPLAAQPEFPLEDVSEANTGILELMLANHAVIEDSHRVADKMFWAYRVGHPAITRLSHQTFANQDGVGAVEHGVMVFEAMTACLSGTGGLDHDHASILAVNQSVHEMVQLNHEGKLTDYAAEARDNFRQALPRACDVLIKSSERFVDPSLRDYVIAGAGTERAIVLGRRSIGSDT